jgi:hypothetical protein
MHELGRIWKKVVMAYLSYHSRTDLNKLMETMKDLLQYPAFRMRISLLVSPKFEAGVSTNLNT